MSGKWSSYEDPPSLSRSRFDERDETEPRKRMSAYASSNCNTRRGGFTSTSVLPPAHSTTIGSRSGCSDSGSRRQQFSRETQQMSSCSGQQSSPVKLFDHAVRSEILRRKKGCQLDSEEERVAILESLATLTRSAMGTSQAMTLTSEGQPKAASVELTEAVDRLMRAEASVAFGGAVKAAQEAVINAPRGLEEEAAAAGARGFGRTTKVTSIEEVRGLLSHGGKPIEVVGFVGITKPRNA